MSNKWSREATFIHSPAACHPPPGVPMYPPTVGPKWMYTWINVQHSDWLYLKNVVCIVKSYDAWPGHYYRFFYKWEWQFYNIWLWINLTFYKWPTEYKIWYEMQHAPVPPVQQWGIWDHQNPVGCIPFYTRKHFGKLEPWYKEGWMTVRIGDNRKLVGWPIP